MGTNEQGQRKKSVTFGDHGSLIETLIDDSSVTEINHNYKESTEHKVYPKEKFVSDEARDLQDDFTDINPPKNRVKFSEEDLLHTNRSEAVSIDEDPEDEFEPIGIMRRAPSTESRDNPFQPDGDISKSAELILRHSKISASEVVIVDPTSPDYNHTEQKFEIPEPNEEKLSPIIDSPVSNEPDISGGNPKVKENGTVEETINPEQVQKSESSPKEDGETSPATATPAVAGDEEPKPTDNEPETKKKECCTIL